MSESKFTPGPCSVHDADGNMSIVHNNSMLTLAFMVGTDIFTGDGFDLKYAHLFAAAPDMYEALKEIARADTIAHSTGKYSLVVESCAESARSILAKLDGIS